MARSDWLDFVKPYLRAAGKSPAAKRAAMRQASRDYHAGRHRSNPSRSNRNLLIIGLLVGGWYLLTRAKQPAQQINKTP